ncbi:MAG: GAF domain-containing protein, partial [Desulfuromonadales bacterium]|nr:GAF domain-containing protein [Desulfuromonadales bacterium]
MSEQYAQLEQKLLTHLVEAFGSETGEQFFEILVVQLCQALKADVAVVGKLVADAELTEVQTLAVYADGRLKPNFNYDFRGTPCEKVLGRNACVYPKGIQQLFPEDEMLAQMQAEGYAGVPLVDSHGRVLGLFTVLFNQEIPEPLLVEQLLRLFAVRACSELERLNHEIDLLERERR